MGFIAKTDPTVINIMLTSKGRELLSNGKLKFSNFAVGDSEIDYNFINVSGIDAFNCRILQAYDKNPNIISTINKTLSSGNTVSEINSINTISYPPITNTGNEYGYFKLKSSTDNSYTLTTNQMLVKQGGLCTPINLANGSISLTIKQGKSFVASSETISIGDYLMVFWANPNGKSTDDMVIYGDSPQPVLIYKIISIVSGSIIDNNLIVNVDRPIPNFNGLGNGIVAGAAILYNSKNNPALTMNSSDFVSEATITFLNNYQTNGSSVPFWNLSNIFTENLIGVRKNIDRTCYQYDTATMAGFVSYIQSQKKLIDNLAIIHYSNQSPINEFGEGLYTNTPIINIPYVMWHKNGNGKLGLILTCSGSQKTLANLNTRYYDLVDAKGNVVGKSFNDLKIFVIEDQELILALSYKSNRSWTLPMASASLSSSITIGCNGCNLYAEITSTNSTIVGGKGTIKINNIMNNYGDVVLEVKTGSPTGSTTIFQKLNVGSLNQFQVSAGKYYVKLYDLGGSNCSYPLAGYSELTISEPVSILLPPYDISVSPCNIDLKIESIVKTTATSINLTNYGSVFGTLETSMTGVGVQPSIWNSGKTTYSSLNPGTTYVLWVRDNLNGDIICTRSITYTQ